MAERDVEVVGCGEDGVRVRLLGSACDGCSGGCGGRCNLFAGDAAGEVLVPRPPTPPLRAGQRLRLVLDDRRLRAAAWSGYGRAWLGLLAGAGAGRLLALAWPTHVDLLTLAGLVSGTFLAVSFSNRQLPEPRLQVPGADPFQNPHTETPPP
jgi:hypothetical protein